MCDDAMSCICGCECGCGYMDGHMVVDICDGCGCGYMDGYLSFMLIVYIFWFSKAVLSKYNNIIAGCNKSLPSVRVRHSAYMTMYAECRRLALGICGL